MTRLRAVAIMLLPLISACGMMATPDRKPIQPAARTARLEELHRVAEFRDRAALAAQIQRRISEAVYGASDRDLEKVTRWIVKYANRDGLDPLLVASVIATESYYFPDVISYAGAVGLMQIIPYVGRDVAKRHHIVWSSWKTLLDPRSNISISSAYLKELIVMFHGDVSLALAAYNMGPTLLKRRLRNGFEPSGPYVTRVMSTYRSFTANTVVDRYHALAMSSS